MTEGHDSLSLWFQSNETEGMEIELEKFRVSAEGIGTEESIGTGFGYTSGLQAYPKKFNQIRITEDRQTQRYIFTYLSNERQKSGAVIEKILSLEYYSMHVNSLSVIIKREDNNKND